MNLRRFVRMGGVAAAVSTSDISRQFYTEWAMGDRYWWWLCAILVDPNDLIVEDEDGKLWRLPYTVGAHDVTFGDLAEVYVEYVDAVARHDTNLVALQAIITTRGDDKVAAAFTERPKDRPKTKEGDHVREYLEKLRAKFQLPADASDEDILKAVAEANPEVDPDADPAPDPSVDPAPGPAPDPNPSPAPAPVPSPQPSARAVTVDAEAFRELQEGARLGREAHNTLARGNDERFVDRAIASGKVPARTRASYLSQIARDRDQGTVDAKGVTETETYLTSLSENVVPVEQRALTPDDPTVDASGVNQDALDRFMSQHMPDVAAAKVAAIGNNGVRPRVMTDN